MALSREKALIIAAKHVESVSKSSVEEELMVLSPQEKVNVVFSPDVAVAFGKKSQDATNLKAVKFDFESPQCFSIGKLPEVNKPPPLTPYGHGVARNLEVMKKFLENAKKDVASTFCFSITKGPCRMVVDLDTKVCEDVTKVENFGHRYIQALADFAGLKKDDPDRKNYMMTTRHRNGKASVHILHNRIHFEDPRHQAAFMTKFKNSKKKSITSLFKEALEIYGDEEPRNNSAIGILDFCIYGSPSGTPGRKWNEDKRTIFYNNGEEDLSKYTFWHADPKKIHPLSKPVALKGLSWGTLKRKADPFTDDVHESNKRTKHEKSAFAKYPKCFSTDFLPVIEKQLGGAGVAQIKGLRQCHSSNRYDFFVEHGSKHQEASRCCKNPTIIHKSNRKKIFVNFEDKEVETYDKKSKTRVTKTFAAGVYIECFKGCNSDCPTLAFRYKQETKAPTAPDFVVEPSSPLQAGDTAVQLEVPKHDPFSVEIRGIGVFTNATPWLRHPFSANPIPKIKRGIESFENFQTTGVPLEIRCYVCKQ